MAKDPQRREEWTEAATDYVLEHGLIGLSLRPLAAELGTSDRMLLYHFGSKDELVAAVLRSSNERSTAYLNAPTLDTCTRLYIEAAALGLFGREPYVSVVREANAVWVAALVDHLVRSGVRRPLARRVVEVLDAAFLGFELDLPLDVDEKARLRAVTDLADAVAAIGR